MNHSWLTTGQFGALMAIVGALAGFLIARVIDEFKRVWPELKRTRDKRFELVDPWITRDHPSTRETRASTGETHRRTRASDWRDAS